jgi:membrane protease YdiL (CAAX protease family)
MRLFLSLMVFLALALVAAAALAYPAWLLVGLVSDQPIHRVMHRIAMLVGCIGLIWIFRRWQVADRTSLGYGKPRAQFVQQLLLGMLVGAVLMLPLMLMLFGLDVREPKPEIEWSARQIAQLLASGLLSGLVVAFIEETFFRGGLLTAIKRESGLAMAIVLPSLLYASVHFLGGRLRIASEDVEWATGFDVLGKLLEKYASPLELADSFFALFAVGVLLAIVRLRTRSIAACIGLHAGWVCTIASVRKTSIVQTDAPASWLVGSYDGVIGWGALGWIGAIVLAYFFMTKQGEQSASGESPSDGRSAQDTAKN